MLTILFNLLYFVINLYFWAIILSAVFSMLSAFGVLDTRNRVVWMINDFLFRVTDPVLRPLRNMLPNLGSIDISPMIVLAVIQLVILPLLQRLFDAITTGRWQGLLT